MARYKYSENTKEVTDIYFDTETHGEFMGMEQSGEMKKVSLPLLQDKIVEKITGDLNGHEADTANPHEVTKEQVGLDEVDNTSDADKPVSNAQQTALNLKETVANVNALKGTDWTDETVKGNAEDIATLNCDDSTEGSVAYDIKQSSDALKGVDYTEGSLKTHEDRLDTLEGADTVSGSVAKTVKDTAQDATFTDASGLDSTTLKDAINEIYAEKAVANGLASLDATGKIPVAQLPVSAMEFKGGWDASSGAYPLTPDVGDFWTVSVAGTTEGVKFDAGDAIVYNGATWDKINKVEIAEEVSYDNSSSGLIATNVQDAIDEVEGRIDDAETALTTLNADAETEGSVAKTVKNAVDPVKGTGWMDENLVDHEVRLQILEFMPQVSSWADVQSLVRAGNSSAYFPVGTQFNALWNGVERTLEVIGIDHDTPTDTAYTHSLTLQFKDILRTGRISGPEAMYNAVTELPAGTYIFTTNGVQYTFTSTQDVPADGVIYIKTRNEYAPLTLTIYDANRTTIVEDNIVVTPTTGTDNLTPINDHIRMRYGSNLYEISAIRQWLNSEDATFVWQPLGLYDMPSSYATAGFINLLDADLQAVIGAVDKQVARANYDGGGQDTFSDKVFLLSRKEIFGDNEGVVTGEVVYPFWDGSSNADRIKGSPTHWWLRSPYVGTTYNTRIVYTSGTLNYGGAYYAFGLSPACVVW